MTAEAPRCAPRQAAALLLLALLPQLGSGYRRVDLETPPSSPARFVPYSDGFTEERADPSTPRAARVNEGNPFSLAQPNLFRGVLPRQSCPGMTGPIEGVYYCSSRDAGYCDRRSGACFCNDGYMGRDCSVCRPSHFRNESSGACEPRVMCPNGCSGGGHCDAATGRCVCDRGRRGADCSLQFCRLLHRWCTECNDVTGCTACEEGWFPSNATSCLSCTLHDPRCSHCNADRCLSCADPLLSSVRRSGRRRQDPMPAYDEYARQLSRAVPFGTQDPTSFEEAEPFYLVTDTRGQAAAGIDAGAYTFFDACTSVLRLRAEARVFINETVNTTVILSAATGPDIDLGMPRRYVVDCSQLPYREVWFGWGPEGRGLEMPVLGPYLDAQLSPIAYPPTQVWRFPRDTDVNISTRAVFATDYLLFPLLREPYSEAFNATIAALGLAAQGTAVSSLLARIAAAGGPINASYTDINSIPLAAVNPRVLFPDSNTSVISTTDLVTLQTRGELAVRGVYGVNDPVPLAPLFPLLNASSFQCDQGLQLDDTWHCHRVPVTHAVCGHAGTLAWESPTYAVLENATYLRVGVNRTGGGMGRVTVEYELVHISTDDADVSATAAYTTSQTLVFEPGVVRLTFLIALHDDMLLEGEPVDTSFLGKPAPVLGPDGQPLPTQGDSSNTYRYDYNWHMRLSPHETFVLRLKSPCCGATIGPQGATTVAILDEDGERVVAATSDSDGLLTLPSPSGVFQAEPPAEALSQFAAIQTVSSAAVTAQRIQAMQYAIAGVPSVVTVTAKDFYGRVSNGTRNVTIVTNSHEAPGQAPLAAALKASKRYTKPLDPYALPEEVPMYEDQIRFPFVPDLLHAIIAENTTGSELFLVTARPLHPATIGAPSTIVRLDTSDDAPVLDGSGTIGTVWDTATGAGQLDRASPAVVSLDFGNTYSYAGRYLSAVLAAPVATASQVGYTLPEPGPHDALVGASVDYQHAGAIETTATYNATTNRYQAAMTITTAGLHSVTVVHAYPGGLRGDYYSNAYLQGKPMLSRVDPYLNFTWGHGPIFKLDGCESPSVYGLRRGSTYGDFQVRTMKTANNSAAAAVAAATKVSGTAGGDGLARNAPSSSSLAAEEAAAAAQAAAAVGSIVGAGIGGPSDKCSGAAFADFVSVRWAGKLRVPAGSGGLYELFLSADDGVRLYLDRALLVDAWSVPGQSSTDFSDADHDSDHLHMGAPLSSFGASDKVDYMDRFLSTEALGGEASNVRPSRLAFPGLKPENLTEPGSPTGSAICTYNRVGGVSLPDMDPDERDTKLLADNDMVCIDGSAAVASSYLAASATRDRVAGATEERHSRTFAAYTRLRQVLETSRRSGTAREDRWRSSLRAPVLLAGGHLHDVVVEYRDLWGHAACRLYWVTPAQRSAALALLGFNQSDPATAANPSHVAGMYTAVSRVASLERPFNMAAEAAALNLTVAALTAAIQALVPEPVPPEVLYSVRQIATKPVTTYIHPAEAYASGPIVEDPARPWSARLGPSRTDNSTEGDDPYSLLSHPPLLPPPFQAATELDALQPPPGSFARGPGLHAVRVGDSGNFTIASRDQYSNDRGVLSALDTYIVQAVALFVDPTLSLDVDYFDAAATTASAKGCGVMLGGNATASNSSTAEDALPADLAGGTVKRFRVTLRDRDDLQLVSTPIFNVSRVAVRGGAAFDPSIGLFRADWRATISGVYAVSVALLDRFTKVPRHIQYSPFIVDARPLDHASPSNSLVTGTGAGGHVGFAVASQVNAIMVQPRDSYNNSLLVYLPEDAYGKGAGSPFAAHRGAAASSPGAAIVTGTSGAVYSFEQVWGPTDSVNRGPSSRGPAPGPVYPVRALDPRHPLVAPHLMEAVAYHLQQDIVVQADVVALAIPVLPFYGGSQTVSPVLVRIAGLDVLITPPAPRSTNELPEHFQPHVQRLRRHYYSLVLVGLYRPTLAGRYQVRLSYLRSGAPIGDSRFIVQVVPGPTHALTTTLHAAPFWYNNGPAPGYLVVRDRFNNVRQGPGIKVDPVDDEVTVTVSSDVETAWGVRRSVLTGNASYWGRGGIYNLTLPCEGFVCVASVKIHGQHVSGSPLTFRRKPGDVDASQSNSWGPALTAAVVGARSWFLIQTRDENGNVRYRPAPPIDASRVKAWLVRVGGVRPDVVEQSIQPSTRRAQQAVADAIAAGKRPPEWALNMATGGVGINPLGVPRWPSLTGKDLPLSSVPLRPVLVGTAISEMLPRVAALLPAAWDEARYGNGSFRLPLVPDTPYYNTTTVPPVWQLTAANVTAGAADPQDVQNIAALVAEGMNSSSPLALPAFVRPLPATDGLIYVDYTVFTAGLYAVYVTIDGKHTLALPRLVPIVSQQLDPVRSDVIGQAAADLVASDSAFFDVIARDTYANRVFRAGIDRDYLSVRLTRVWDPDLYLRTGNGTIPSPDLKPVEVAVAPRTDVPGAYACGYRATAAGTYILDARYSPPDAGVRVQYYRRAGLTSFFGSRLETNLNHEWTYDSLYAAASTGDKLAEVVMSNVGASVRKYGFLRPLFGMESDQLAMLAGLGSGDDSIEDPDELVTVMVETSGMARLMIAREGVKRVNTPDVDKLDWDVSQLGVGVPLGNNMFAPRADGSQITSNDSNWVVLIDTAAGVGRLGSRNGVSGGTAGVPAKWYASITLKARRFYGMVVDYQEPVKNPDQQPCLSGCILRVQLSSRSISVDNIFGYGIGEDGAPLTAADPRALARPVTSWRGITIPRLLLFPPLSKPISLSPYYVYVRPNAAYAPNCIVQFLSTATADEITVAKLTAGNKNTKFDAVYAAANNASFIVTLRDRYNNTRAYNDEGADDVIMPWGVMLRPASDDPVSKPGDIVLTPPDFKSRYIGRGQHLVSFVPLQSGLYAVFVSINAPPGMFSASALSVTTLEDAARAADVLVNPNDAYTVLVHVVPSTVLHPLDAQFRTFGYGEGMERAEAGKEASFFIQLVDTTGNNVTGYGFQLCSETNGLVPQFPSAAALSVVPGDTCQIAAALVWEQPLPGQRDSYGPFDPHRPRSFLDPTARADLSIHMHLSYYNGDGVIQVKYTPSTSGLYRLHIFVADSEVVARSAGTVEVKTSLASPTQTGIEYTETPDEATRDRFNAALVRACRALANTDPHPGAVCTRTTAPVLVLERSKLTKTRIAGYASNVMAAAVAGDPAVIRLRLRDRFANPLVVNGNATAYVSLRLGAYYKPVGTLDSQGWRQWIVRPERDGLFVRLELPDFPAAPALAGLTDEAYWLDVHAPLAPVGGGLTASYYKSWRQDDDASAGLVRVEPLIATSRLWVSPDTSPFTAVTWSGFVQTPVDATYTFTATCDSPCSLRIDGVTVFNHTPPEWQADHRGPPPPPRNVSGRITLHGAQLFSVYMRAQRLTDPSADVSPGVFDLLWAWGGGLGLETDTHRVPTSALTPESWTSKLSNAPIPILVVP